jgi:hypothetical protein
MQIQRCEDRPGAIGDVLMIAAYAADKKLQLGCADERRGLNR